MEIVLDNTQIKINAEMSVSEAMNALELALQFLTEAAGDYFIRIELNDMQKIRRQMRTLKIKDLIK